MNEDEVEYVAVALARNDGASWPVGKEASPVVRYVRNRFMDRARVVIAALDRFRAAKKVAERAGEIDEASPMATVCPEATGSGIQVGQTIMYQPPGDRRAMPCRVTKILGGQAYIVPIPINEIGWVHLGGFSNGAPEAGARQ